MNILTVVQPGRPLLHEREQVDPFVLGQAEGVADALQHLVGDAHLATLLEPGVPGDADAGERGHVLAPQALRTAPLGLRQAQVGRLDACATIAEEFGALPIDGKPGRLPGSGNNRIDTPRLYHRYCIAMFHTAPPASSSSNTTFIANI